MLDRLRQRDLFHSDNFVTVWLASLIAWAFYFVGRSSIAVVASVFVQNLDTRILSGIFGFGLSVVGATFLNWVTRNEIVRMTLFIAIIFPLFSYAFSVANDFIYIRLNPDIEVDWNPYFPFPGAVVSGTWIALWGCLYFGTSFFLKLQLERERVLRATALAHEAQLKMLRYQLNPHFLFNTLNGISTLVLDKKNLLANQVLVKLSQFLRHTLDSAPEQSVTLTTEINAIQLYLDIEKTRFEDRLTIKTEISEESRDCLIPSLLLQPLIENSIKYAVAPFKSGGTIVIKSHVDKRQLVLEVEDDGPGIPEGSENWALRSGVGLTNTQLRLEESFGEQASLQLENQLPRGLKITIRIPAVYKNA